MQMRRGLAVVVAAAAAGCGTMPATKAPPACTPFVDAHVHLNDLAMQRGLMQRHCATRAIVFWGRAGDNDAIAAHARAHPELFIPFASISPERRSYRPGWVRDPTNILAQLDGLLATGLYKGIGEISAVHFPSPGLPEADFDPSGPAMRGILALARKHRVPVMVHIEVTRLRELSVLLEAYADVPVIWAHGGYTPAFLARRMLERHPNLHYELSARTWPRHPRSPDYTIMPGGKLFPEWLQLVTDFPARFVVGSDASHRTLESDTMKYESVQAFLAQLPAGVREKVARENLLALLAP